METVDPSDDDEDPRAVPGVRRAPEQDGPTSAKVTVDGEVFVLRRDQHGGTEYTWLSGPNPGYGFGVSPTQDWSPDQHRETIRGFLAEIDPTTGYLAED